MSTVPAGPTDPSALPAEALGQAPSRHRLVDRHVVVVGAGAQGDDLAGGPIGNGRAIALLAAREGAVVGCVDMDTSSAERTASQVEAEGGRAYVVTADVSKAEDCEQVVRVATDRSGPLDGLVLNVGLAAPLGLAGTSVEAWDHVMSVNVRSHFLVSQAAADHMGAGGSIVLVSSVGAIKPHTNMPAYIASKNAVHGLCRHLGYELGPAGIRANVVCPGRIDTPLARRSSPLGATLKNRSEVPLGRKGTGWEIAYATVFLLSGEASYITGQVLAVDGGTSTLR